MKTTTPHAHSTLAVAAFVLTACAPLQQAPLVYASKVIVGLDVSANFAENQGGSVSIGVKTVDSAYVPVAVSKELDTASERGEKTIEIKLIEARYGEGSSPDTSDDATTAERNRKIDAYFSAKQALDAAVTAQSNAENTVSGLTTLIAQLDALKSSIKNAQNIPEPPPSAVSAPAPATSPRAEAFKQSANDVAKVNGDKKVVLSPLALQADGKYNESQVLADIDREIGISKSSKQMLESQLPDLKVQRQAKLDEAARAKVEAIRVVGLSQTNKTDAMSVYGRFDTTGSGGTKDGATANLLVGKVFSTGLASQNLTEAVKLEAASRCLASGIEAAKSLTDPGRTAFLEGLAKMCTARTGSAASK